MPRKLTLLLMTLFLTTAMAYGQNSNGRITDVWGYVNLRAEPSRTAPVLAELQGNTPINVTGRTESSTWLQVLGPDGSPGWVVSTYVELVGDIASLPVVEGAEVTTTAATTTDPGAAEAPATTGTTATTGATVTGTAAGTARVIAGILNLRSAPSEAGEVITQLPFDTLLSLFTRTADARWVQVTTSDGTVGWVAARYINPNTPVSNLPVGEGTVPVVTTTTTGEDGEVVEVAAAAPVQVSEIITIGSATRGIFARGQQTGKRRDVFAKVGDSITFNPIMYTPMGTGNYILGDYPGLGATIEFFGSTTARNSNSFANDSLAAAGGWTAEAALNPQNANQELCAPEESPIACEYRYTRPAVAMIMFGTNDVQQYSVGEFAYYMREIIDYTIEQGIIPVISTVPLRSGFEGRVNEYNVLIESLASEYGIPLWDYNLAMQGLPNFGLGNDGTHPSVPPDGANNGANFQFPYLNYGYVMRNLTALQVLEALRINVLGG